MTFDTFVPVRGAEEALEAARVFCDGGKPKMLTLTGPRGCGKTHLLASIGRVMFDKGAWLQFTTAAALLDSLRDTYEEDSGYGFETLFRAYAGREVLLLDDVGLGVPTEWAVEKLTRLVDHRYAHEMPTVISTNLTEEELGRGWGPTLADRVYDRGSGRVRVVAMTCRSYRTGREW